MDQRFFGQAIKRIRLIRGMSRPELARAAGLPAEAVSQVEQGKHAAPKEVMFALAKALRLPRGCLAILARSGGKTKPMTDFVRSLHELIAVLVEAQEDGVAMENGATERKERRKAV